MKLLFDENISHKILKKIDSVYKESFHCNSIRPLLKNDLEIWEYARNNNFSIVTFDEDFYEWMVLKGFPPKIIWLRTGNTSTNDIANSLNLKVESIKEFLENPDIGILEIY